MKVLLLSAAILVALWSAGMCEEGQHNVGVDWRWFTGYYYFSGDWTLDAESGCDLEYGTGIKLRDTPLGGRHKFSNHVAFTTYGLGAIYVRAIAGRAPCLVRLRQGNATAISIYGDPSVIKGAIHDGKIVFEKARGG